MKITFLSILSLCANLLFANQSLQIPTPPLPVLNSQPEENQNLLYFKFTGGENNLIHPQQPAPGLGIGIRNKTPLGAIDISVSGIGLKQRNRDNYQFLFPKVSYLSYFTPKNEYSFYSGGGLAWGLLYNDDTKFTGIIAHVTLGYEYLRTVECTGFTEITLSQPALSIQSLNKYPSPSFEISTGLGF